MRGLPFNLDNLLLGLSGLFRLSGLSGLFGWSGDQVQGPKSKVRGSGQTGKG